LILLLTGCQSAYYGAMEKLGVHKRDILVDRVEEAKDAQEEAKEQFATAFEEFLAVSGVEVTDLKRTYDSLKVQFDASSERAEAVHERISGIRSVAKALFKEWESELEQYTSPTLREASAAQLKSTRDLYESLITAMDQAASKMKPVLDAFRDQTLFLKHNLNAQAIAALNETSLSIKDEVQVLIEQMEESRVDRRGQQFHKQDAQRRSGRIGEQSRGSSQFPSQNV